MGETLTPAQVWAKANSDFDGPAQAVKSRLLSDRKVQQKCLNGWRAACQQFGTSEVVAVFSLNRPGATGDELLFMPLDQFEQSAALLAVDDANVEQVRQAYATSRRLAFPPICAIWHDGNPNGNFVSEVLLLLAERRR